METSEIWLTTAATSQDFLSMMPLFLLEKMKSTAFGIVYYLHKDNSLPNCPNSYDSLHA